MLFVGPGVRHWADRCERGIHWIASPPLASKPNYPCLLDLADAVRQTLPAPWPLLEKASRALAPTWSELCVAGLNPSIPRSPEADELGASDEAPIIQHFLAKSLAQVLARLENGFGLLIRSAELWDVTSLEFLDRLVREPSRRTPVAIETFGIKPLSPMLASFLHEAEQIPLREQRTPAIISAGEKLLSLCAHGLPFATFQTLGGRVEGPPDEFRWPGAGTGLALSPARAAFVRRSIPKKERMALNALIFDAHPYTEWDYIRRCGYAVFSGDPVRLLSQHTACLAGLSHIGYDYLYRHLAALAAVLPEGEAFAAHLGAARLAPRIWGIGGRQKAIFHYRRALKVLDGAAAAVPVMQELANLYANMRTPEALRESRSWYDTAFNSLEQVTDTSQRLSLEIRLHNGVALVSYHEGKNEAALDHERQALALVANNSDSSPQVAQWANPLIRTNTAKLLIKRFGDPDGGIALLQSLLDTSEERVLVSTRQNLARVCFDKADYAGVVEHLAERTEGLQKSEFSESEELYDRLIFTLSLLALGNTLRAKLQIPRMRYLARANASVQAEVFIYRLAVIAGEVDILPTNTVQTVRT